MVTHRFELLPRSAQIRTAGRDQLLRSLYAFVYIIYACLRILYSCGNGFKLIDKQITASPDAEVTVLEFHYAISNLNGEREFTLKNIRLTPKAK